MTTHGGSRADSPLLGFAEALATCSNCQATKTRCPKCQMLTCPRCSPTCEDPRLEELSRAVRFGGWGHKPAPQSAEAKAAEQPWTDEALDRLLRDVQGGER